MTVNKKRPLVDMRMADVHQIDAVVLEDGHDVLPHLDRIDLDV